MLLNKVKIKYYEFLQLNKNSFKTLGFKFRVYSHMIFLFELLNKESLIYFIYNQKHKIIEKYLLKILDPIIFKYKTNNITDNVISHKGNLKTKIFVAWFQGFDNAPILVKSCINKLIELNPDKEVIILSEVNLSFYIEDLPQNLKNMYLSSEITKQVFSDILRSFVLSKYGGYWCDATLFTTKSIPSEIEKYNFYSIHNDNGPKKFVSQRKWTAYFMYSAPGCILTNFLIDSFEAYFKRHNFLIDYWLVDYIIHVGYKYNDQISKLINLVPINNGNVSKLSPIINQPFNKEIFDNITKDTFIFKLDWRKKILNVKNSFFYKIVQTNGFN